MIKPYIYGVADPRYMRLYGHAFLNSARAHGHQADVFVAGWPISTGSQKMRYCAWRFQMMPELLTKFPAVLMLDVDSIILRPFEVDDEYDLGLFVRYHDQHKANVRTIGGIFYCTPRAIEFAQAMADDVTKAASHWGDDQAALWRTYAAHGSKYRVKLFDKTDMDWEPKSKARIFTGKGDVKRSNAFLDALNRWSPAAC